MKKKIEGILNINIRWQLVLYDVIVFAVVNLFLLVLYRSNEKLMPMDILCQASIFFACTFISRFCFKIYRQIWRYGGVECYLRLIISDSIALVFFTLFEFVLPVERIVFARILSLSACNLLIALAMRIMYRYAYKFANRETLWGKTLTVLLKLFANYDVHNEKQQKTEKIKVAILGAGKLGVGLATELISNPNSSYTPVCFIDINDNKIGRKIHGLRVLPEQEANSEALKKHEVQEIVFAIPDVQAVERKRLYEFYKKAGYKIKVYDYPAMRVAGGKRHLREFDVEELLFREPIAINDDITTAYYKDKVILITGGGGSIGSEICRQLAKMSPKQIVVLDVYENGAYNVQQELRIAYKGKLNLKVEIVSVCNKVGLERVFDEYRPQIVINAAAHKHVPLMEKNCIEAVENNIFGTLNTIELAEKYEAERFMMVSTDKAVNPTNVMGATKRFCEMIVQCHSQLNTNTKFSVTRFGNVLGSAGSVIPLFKNQIANGGPVTVTDKRIIRYFMTIPEASQLVLESGAMAKNGELFVLDMGNPVAILELAENMVRLAGYEPYKDIDIVETGLRPGEKLYEELLVKTEELDKTSNSLIFIERDNPISLDDLNSRLEMLRYAVDENDDDKVREALRIAVPTYKTPEEVNNVATKSVEMCMAK